MIGLITFARAMHVIQEVIGVEVPKGEINRCEDIYM